MNLRSHYPGCSSFSFLLPALLSASPHSQAQLQVEDGLHPTAGAIPYFPCIALWIPLPGKLVLKPVQLYVSLP